MTALRAALGHIRADTALFTLVAFAFAWVLIPAAMAAIQGTPA